MRPADQDRAARAADALARARAQAAARGARRTAASAADESAARDPAGAGGPVPGTGSGATPRGAGTGSAGRRQRRDDPAPLAAAIEGLITESGWEMGVATGSVFGRWVQIVGPDLAAHTAPEHLADGELVVGADSTAWATQLRLLAADLVRRLNAELGDGSVRRVRVHGPGGPSRRPGEWRIRGGRGPRDTYG